MHLIWTPITPQLPCPQGRSVVSIPWVERSVEGIATDDGGVVPILDSLLCTRMKFLGATTPQEPLQT